jgi:predicted  nucleic acid-binding Zn-ribbon protein
MANKKSLVQLVNFYNEQVEDLMALQAEITEIKNHLTRVETRRQNLKFDITQTEATIKEIKDAENN